MYYIVNNGKQNYSVRLTLATPILRVLSTLAALFTVTLCGSQASAFARFPVDIHENS